MGQNLQLNEEGNGRVAVVRKERLKREETERMEKIKFELEEFERSEAERIAAANKYIREQAVEIDGRIREEEIEEAISKALSNPMDFEYAIDTEGNIFKGRITRAKDMSPNDYEKLPMAGEVPVSVSAETS